MQANNWMVSLGIQAPIITSNQGVVHDGCGTREDIEERKLDIEMGGLFEPNDDVRTKIIKLFDAHPHLDCRQIASKLKASVTYARSMLVSSGRIKRVRDSHKIKPVVQLSIDGKYIETFESQMDASRATGVDSAGISKCCNHVNGRQIACGYRFVYLKDYQASINFDRISNRALAQSKKKTGRNGTEVVQLSKLGRLIKTHKTMSAAAREVGCCVQLISDASSPKNKKNKTAYGFVWMHLADYEKMFWQSKTSINFNN